MAVANKKILAGMEKSKKGILSLKSDVLIIDSKVRKVVGNKFAANFQSILDTIDAYISSISEFCAQSTKIKSVSDYLGSKTLYRVCDRKLSPLRSEALLDGNLSGKNMEIQTLVLNAIEKAGDNDWAVVLLILEFKGK